MRKRIVESLNNLVEHLASNGHPMGIQAVGVLESAIAQPQMTFDGEEEYPRLLEKAAAFGFSIIMNHPFVDESNRTGHAAMETFLVLNRIESKLTLLGMSTSV